MVPLRVRSANMGLIPHRYSSRTCSGRNLIPSVSQSGLYLRPLVYSGNRKTHNCAKNDKPNTPKPSSIASLDFWSSQLLWKRAGINTFRCLVGCSLGDFSAMWFLQANNPDIGTGLIMGISSMLSFFFVSCFSTY